MKTEFINHNKNSLILFFCGFYTDANCFVEFDNGKSDILFVYDYSDMENNPIEYFDFLNYTQVSVIAYSYGVWALNYVYNQDLLPQIYSSCGCVFFLQLAIRQGRASSGFGRFFSFKYKKGKQKNRELGR